MNKMVAFILGTGVGAGVMAYVCKTKYEVMIQEELESIKQSYNEKLHDAGYITFDSEDAFKNLNRETEDPTEDNMMEHASRLSKKAITNYSAMSAVKEEKGDEEVPKNVVIKEELDVIKEKIQAIPPDEYGDDTDYDTITLTLYLDGIITDEDDDPISHVEDIIGNALQHFGDYEEDRLFIRNDANHTYYEVIRDERNYSEV